MPTTASGGSPPDQFAIHDSLSDKNESPPNERFGQPSTTSIGVAKEGDGLTPLGTSKLGNIQAQQHAVGGSGTKGKTERALENSQHPRLPSGAMDALLAKLTEQKLLLNRQRAAASAASLENPEEGKSRQSSSGSSARMTPVSDSIDVSTDGGDDKARREAAETAVLKKQLDDAKALIARQKQELEQSRVMKLTMDQAMGPSSEATTSPLIGRMKSMFNGTSTFHAGTRQSWNPTEDLHSETADIGSTANIWNNRSGFHAPIQHELAFNQDARGHNLRNVRNSTMPSMMMSPQGSEYSTPLSPRGSGRLMQGVGQYNRGFAALQSNRQDSGFGLFNHRADQISSNNTGGLHPGAAYQSMNAFSSVYQPQPIGTPLSPTAAEFQLNQVSENPWNAAAPTSPGQTYVSPMEPLNYRRLLDRSVNCNWKYIVDKIVCNNDQQASIFLQQKLKVGTVEQKFDIVEAIVAQAYPLMVNRFGNFLVQRCFEHGTPEQVVAIAGAIRGNTLSLSMDAFGCHVVQKAFDAVPEDYKAIMVHELLRRIPETVIHRYACHVWQKLFELRWADSPPQIMKYVNEALRGMWHEVALGETGSLVVQNIFENCLEEDKRPCINEVIASIDIVSHGQFGNWCIQHICEHGSPADRGRAIDHVLRYATEYSTDQFASKVVEKCLKIGGAEFLQRYLDRVCEGRPDRPRIPLIDIASDQYGNYLIQFILSSATPQHREMVAGHIRKHMVSLRGSKFGSRVGMLCNNPAYATHPGQGPSLPGNNHTNNRYSSAPVIPRFGATYR